MVEKLSRQECSDTLVMGSLKKPKSKFTVYLDLFHRLEKSFSHILAQLKNNGLVRIYAKGASEKSQT